ncbi:hypothetical protein GOODEAATRI_008034 [Goodea atripinnis]|uniref:Uncharacterized protein n=1 Tax=Goodea atripinnis TaxID=208336 RepID=A0ABV0PCC1_9TELE
MKLGAYYTTFTVCSDLKKNFMIERLKITFLTIGPAEGSQPTGFFKPPKANWAHLNHWGDGLKQGCPQCGSRAICGLRPDFFVAPDPQFKNGAYNRWAKSVC